LNLAAVSPETRRLFGRWWWLIPVLGLAGALLVVGVDLLFFDGATVRRLPDLSADPHGGHDDPVPRRADDLLKT
jgi:hypothetical protein